MVLIISDATLIIFLAKLELLPYLSQIFERVILPTQVFNEIVTQGKKNKRMDALLVDQYITEGKIQVQNISKTLDKQKLMNDMNIHDGEAEAILLYQELQADLLGTDDYRTLKTCRLLNVKYFTTLMFLTKCVGLDLLSVEQGLQKIDQLSTIGWYKDEILIHFRTEIVKIKKGD